MTLLLIGAVVGLALGFTGSGGTLIALPLFLQLLKLDLGTATTYSLVIVVIAAIVNLAPQFQRVNFSVALPLIPLSGLASFFSTPYKSRMPNEMVVLIIILVAVFSLLTIWKVVRFPEQGPGNENTGLTILKSGFFGLVLGALATFTGLGGGVILLPVLTGIYHLDQADALATGLFVILMSSGLSLSLQALEGMTLPDGLELLLLTTGIVVAVFALKRLAPFNPLHQRIAYSSVVVFALVRLIVTI